MHREGERTVQKTTLATPPQMLIGFYLSTLIVLRENS
jgi:hypothetical protein